MEAKEFVLAFENKAVSIETKYELLLKAADLHAKKYKDCMNGMGIDRHLFALYIVCKGQGYVSIHYNNRVYVRGHKYVLGRTQTHFKMSLIRAQNIFMPKNITLLILISLWRASRK